MLSLTDVFSVSSALRDPDLDVELRALLGYRAWHMCVEHEAEIGAEVQLFVIDPADYPEAINRAVGFAITGDDAEAPSFLSIEDHGRWFEIAYARDDDPHTRIFVESGSGCELGIHAMCLSHFWPDDEGEGA